MYPALKGEMNNFLLAKGDYWAVRGVGRGASFTMVSDQANTQISIAFGIK
jgi:hypothetical protein